MTCRRAYRRLARLPADEGGSISISSVFAVLVLVMLVGMVLNTGRAVHEKVRLQNAADAATYAGAVVVGRSLNTLAYTNHLISDMFALTAYLREARDRAAEALTPDILDNWERIGPALAGAEFRKFADLGSAIQQKVPHEREVVAAFSAWAAAASDLMLPVFEEILARELIPEFQRAVVRTTAPLAQWATQDVARRHGEGWPRPMRAQGVLWRTNGDRVAVGGASARVLPVIDPVRDAHPDSLAYLATAQEQRFELAHRYLRGWNMGSLPVFDYQAKMSQFGSLWRMFTGGHLQRLLNEEYPYSNLPFQIETPPVAAAGRNFVLERDYMFVGVVYCRPQPAEMPVLFRRPMSGDLQAYAQAMVFVPTRRIVKSWILPGTPPPPEELANSGVPGEGLAVSRGQSPPWSSRRVPVVIRQSAALHPDQWTLISQNWTAQLVPATSRHILRILSEPPQTDGEVANAVADLTALTEHDLMWLSNH